MIEIATIILLIISTIASIISAVTWIKVKRCAKDITRDEQI
jgi:hypothetical protein